MNIGLIQDIVCASIEGCTIVAVDDAKELDEHTQNIFRENKVFMVSKETYLNAGGLPAQFIFFYNIVDTTSDMCRYLYTRLRGKECSMHYYWCK